MAIDLFYKKITFSRRSVRYAIAVVEMRVRMLVSALAWHHHGFLRSADICSA